MKKTIILLTVLTITGCATSEPKMYDLLYREGVNNLAYKSITIKDYKGEDYNTNGVSLEKRIRTSHCN